MYCMLTNEPSSGGSVPAWAKTMREARQSRGAGRSEARVALLAVTREERVTATRS